MIGKWGGILTRKPVVIFLAACALVTVPPYVSRGFELFRVPEITPYILIHSVRRDFAPLFPLANGLALLLLAGVLFRGALFYRPFSLFLSVAYLLAGILQNVSVSDRYGFSVSVSTLLVALLTAGLWLREFLTAGRAVQVRIHSGRLLALLPFALLALWQPVHPETRLPDLQLGYFLSSGSSLTFCMLTIVSLSVMIYRFPEVDRLLLFVSAAFGLLIGIGNLWLEFLYQPDLFWVGVLHLPLVALSVIGLRLAWKDV
jgi:hypothetical protein